jgi:hypothetical protein
VKKWRDALSNKKSGTMEKYALRLSGRRPGGWAWSLSYFKICPVIAVSSGECPVIRYKDKLPA